MNIICSTDKNFVCYTGVMLTSLLKHNAGCHIYVIVDETDFELTKTQLSRLQKRFDCQIDVLMVEANLLKDFPTINGSITIATYYKIFSTELLPTSVDKVLYLDSDMLIRDSLQELWDTDITDYAMAGVRDLYDNSTETYERLQYPREYGYLNAGMLLLNLRWWREHDVYHRCLDYIRDNHDRILWCEQDVLNAVLAEHKSAIPLRFNYQIPMLMSFHYDILSPEQQQAIREEHDPAIVHYIGSEKPWRADYYGCPYGKEWLTCKRRSLWWREPLKFHEQNKLKTIIKRYLLWPLGWKRRNPYIKF